jgi:hypothetical protein
LSPELFNLAVGAARDILILVVKVLLELLQSLSFPVDVLQAAAERAHLVESAAAAATTAAAVVVAPRAATVAAAVAVAVTLYLR